MKKLFRLGRLALAGTVLAIIFVLALLLYSPKFNQWLVLNIAAIVPGLSIDKVDGLLLSEVHIHGLKLQIEQVDINIASASYQLNLTDLLTQQVQVEYLHVSGVDVVLKETVQPEDKETEAISFVMPVKISVDDFILYELQITQNDTNYLIHKIALALEYHRQEIKLSQFFLDSEIIKLQGEAELQLESQFPFHVDLAVEKSIPELADIKTRLKLQGDSQKIYLEADMLNPSELHAQGWIDFTDTLPGFDLTCAWRSLQWPLQGDKQYASENAEISLQGSLDDYKISLDSDIFTKDLSTGKLQLLGQGDTEQLTLNSLTVKALGGEIQSKGRISWTDNIPSQLQLMANNIQLSSIIPDYPSELNLDAHMSGRLINDPDFRVQINTLNGNVLDKPLHAKADIRYTAEQLLIDQIQTRIGENSLLMAGAVGENNAVEFTLDAANLHELSTDFSGAVYVEGSLQGAISQTALTFNVLSDGLQFQQQQLGSLNAKGHIAATGEGQLNLQMNARKLVVNEITIDKIELQSIGQFTHHDLRANVVSELGNLELAMQGAWDSQDIEWQGQIQQLKFAGKTSGIWQIIKVTPLAVKLAKPEAMQLQTDLCLSQRSGTGLLCVQATNDQYKGQSIAGNIRQLPLSVFKYWLPDTLRMDSLLEAKFSLQSKPDLQGEIGINLDPGSIKYDHEQTGLQIISFQSATFDAQLYPDKLHSNFNSNVSIVLNDENHIEGQVKVTGLEDTKTANINGLLNIQLQNIDFMDAFIDSIHNISGEVNAQLQMQGLLSAPQLNGSKVSLSQGKLFVPEMGLQVHDINIELSHADQQQLALQGKATIAEQQLVIDGGIDQYINDQFKFKVAIKGDQLQVMQTPEMQVWVSPDLHVEGDKQGAKLEGEMNIPKAILVFESLPAGAVALSEDEVIITETKAVPKAPAYPFDADINIMLGDSVSIEGFGLKTHLQGQLHAVQKKNQLKLFDELRSVKGTYKAYGQDLTIEKGQLIFTGDMENPGINILASRKASDWEDKTIAYLRMTGTLKNPVTTVYTEPALIESEALAYLLTGAPLGKSDSSNASLIAAAAMSLGRDYVDALMGVVGIDEFDMKSTSVGQNSMVIGKRISADLYARYIMDVLTSEMQFAVIYKLTQNISIETRAGSTHSSDIRYNIEFD